MSSLFAPEIPARAVMAASISNQAQHKLPIILGCREQINAGKTIKRTAGYSRKSLRLKRQSSGTEWCYSLPIAKWDGNGRYEIPGAG
jgi:hypothetical protein